jgi:hypothetical protein
VSDRVVWRARDGAAVEGTPTWEATVGNIHLTVRRWLGPNGPSFWFTASWPGEGTSSLWSGNEHFRSWATLEEAQGNAVYFARKVIPEYVDQSHAG